MGLEQLHLIVQFSVKIVKFLKTALSREKTFFCFANDISFVKLYKNKNDE